MNRKFKAISAALLAAVMCASFAGCANNENPSSGNSKDNKLNESNIESHLESAFGNSSSNQPSSTTSEPSEPEEIKFAATDEIKKAELNSGLVQLNNDIFQRGGYLTVADFVAKYKDSYDITYVCPQNHIILEAGTYDECKDYLLEYYDTFFKTYRQLGKRWSERESGMGKYHGALYSLKLTPKNGKNASPVIAYVVNATSPDEKITLENAIVAEIEPNTVNYKFTTPEWVPMGFNEFDFQDYESENKNYTVKTLCEMLEAKGLKEIEATDYTIHYNTYKKESNGIGCNILGEENLFGAKPLYHYYFSIDSNTDKVQYAYCTLECFVKE